MKSENILKPVQNYIFELENDLKNVVEQNKNELCDDVLGFLFAKSKRLRPAFVFLLALLLDKKVDENIQKIALCLEILHSATLVHDDIIDEETKRREIESFYSKFGQKKALIIGDYLFSLALLKLSSIENQKISKIFADNILLTINGEINQFKSSFSYPSEGEYLKKSSLKTANLFVCAACAVCEYFSVSEEKRIKLEKFANYFGTIFQIKNDTKDLKSVLNDAKMGTYTLCAIYFRQKYSNCDIINMTNEQFLECSNLVQDKTEELFLKAKELLEDDFREDIKELLLNLLLSF